jgi:hypothetical protein
VHPGGQVDMNIPLSGYLGCTQESKTNEIRESVTDAG